jgi:hypothetical protein
MKTRFPLYVTLALSITTVCCAEPNGYDLLYKTIDHTNYDPSWLSNDDIANAANLDVYFEHASVGGYIIGPGSGFTALAALNSRYTCDRATWDNTATASWFDNHNGLGDNSRGNPGANLKISGFSSSMNASSGLLPGKVDVAMYKFCYIDSPSDAEVLFDTVRSAMTILQAAYPDVVFVWWTMPIETTSNAERQTYNNLVRSYCSANEQWLFDIAAIESHNDVGVLQKDGTNREILYSGYSADGGHPNDAGALKLAKAYWRLIAGIAKTR